MDPIQSLDARIASRHLLDHPFYQRWNAGTLTTDELREYARQYFHYAMAFPTFVSAMHAHTDDLATRQMLLENLIDFKARRTRDDLSRDDGFRDLT
jgi:pyrroloquinoline-quinone synthase